MIKQKSRLSRREILFIFIIIIIALPLVCWKLVGAPLYTEIKTLRESTSAVEKECNQLRALIADEEAIITAWSQWQETSARLNRAIPDQSELTGVLGAIEEMLGTFPGTVQSLHVDESIDYDHYSAADLSISIADRPAGIRTLLSRLASFPHFTTVENIVWTLQDENTVQLDLGLRLFFYNPASTEDVEPERG